jgi:tripartite-type tricarboxylate transporter receptor subunit TctC
MASGRIAMIGRTVSTVTAIALALASAMLDLESAHADSVADFYKGRTVEIYVGYSTGGGYDIYARALARQLGRFIPGNPTVLVKNMPGAGSLRLTNWLANAAPRDGTVFGTIGRGTAFDPVLGQPGAEFNGPDLSWIGSMNREVSICAAWHDAGVNSFEDLKTKGLLIGGVSPNDDTVQFARVLNSVLGTKLKIVAGYPGGNDVVLAMERGEVKGRCGWSWSSVVTARPAWIKEKKIKVLVQLSLSKHPDLPDVPLITDLATNPAQRQMLRLIFARQVMGRPFVAPPGIPPERLAALRRAFMQTLEDKDFVAEAAKARLEIDGVGGEEVAKLVKELYATPADVAKQAAAALK